MPDVLGSVPNTTPPTSACEEDSPAKACVKQCVDILNAGSPPNVTGIPREGNRTNPTVDQKAKAHDDITNIFKAFYGNHDPSINTFRELMTACQNQRHEANTLLLMLLASWHDHYNSFPDGAATELLSLVITPPPLPTGHPDGPTTLSYVVVEALRTIATSPNINPQTAQTVIKALHTIATSPKIDPQTAQTAIDVLTTIATSPNINPHTAIEVLQTIATSPNINPQTTQTAIDALATIAKTHPDPLWDRVVLQGFYSLLNQPNTGPIKSAVCEAILSIAQWRLRYPNNDTGSIDTIETNALEQLVRYALATAHHDVETQAVLDRAVILFGCLIGNAPLEIPDSDPVLAAWSAYHEVHSPSDKNEEEALVNPPLAAHPGALSLHLKGPIIHYFLPRFEQNFDKAFHQWESAFMGAAMGVSRLTPTTANDLLRERVLRQGVWLLSPIIQSLPSIPASSLLQAVHLVWGFETFYIPLINQDKAQPTSDVIGIGTALPPQPVLGGMSWVAAHALDDGQDVAHMALPHDSLIKMMLRFLDVLNTDTPCDTHSPLSQFCDELANMVAMWCVPSNHDLLGEPLTDNERAFLNAPVANWFEFLHTLLSLVPRTGPIPSRPIKSTQPTPRSLIEYMVRQIKMAPSWQAACEWARKALSTAHRSLLEAKEPPLSNTLSGLSPTLRMNGGGTGNMEEAEPINHDSKNPPGSAIVISTAPPTLPMNGGGNGGDGDDMAEEEPIKHDSRPPGPDRPASDFDPLLDNLAAFASAVPGHLLGTLVRR